MEKQITANTYVGDLGQYVESFVLTFAPGTDLSGVTKDSFLFRNTSKHPAAGHPSFGVWKLEKEENTLKAYVDPFFFNDEYRGELRIGGETVGLSKADVTKMNVAVVDDFEVHTTQRGMVYRLLVPESEEPLPLVVAFHGNGERGTDSYRHMVNNRIVTKWGEPVSQGRYRCIVLGPQASDTWSDEELADVRGIIDGLIAEKKADPRRIYVAGIAPYQVSMRFTIANTDLLAASLMMLFWKKYTPEDLSALADFPIWMAIAVNDFTGEAPFAKETFEYIRDELHNEKAKCTIFTEEQMMSYGLYGRQAHAGWIPALDSPEICDWLFSHVREDK